MKSKLMYFFIIVFLILVFYTMIVFTDTMRFKNGNIPIFAMSIKTDTTEDGYENTYIGIGYKAHEKKDKTGYVKEVTLFGSHIYLHEDSYIK